MKKRRVFLIQMQPLLGEGLQHIFQKLEDVELTCLPCTDLDKIEACLNDGHPDMILLAGEKEDDQSTHLISYLLKQYEDIPIVWIDLETNRLRLFTSHSLTANSAELIHAMRENGVGQVGANPLAKKQGSSPQRR